MPIRRAVGFADRRAAGGRTHRVCRRNCLGHVRTVPCTRTPTAPLTGVLFGVNLDWGHEQLSTYAAQLGHHPAVAFLFAGSRSLPRTEEHPGGRRPGPRTGRDAPPHSATHRRTGVGDGCGAHRLRVTLTRINDSGVPVIVRFAHEMNGSWYPWGAADRVRRPPSAGWRRRPRRPVECDDVGAELRRRLPLRGRRLPGHGRGRRIIRRWTPITTGSSTAPTTRTRPTTRATTRSTGWRCRSTTGGTRTRGAPTSSPSPASSRSSSPEPTTAPAGTTWPFPTSMASTASSTPNRSRSPRRRRS